MLLIHSVAGFDLVSLAPDAPADEALLKRLVDAWHSAMNGPASSGDGLWGDIRDSFHGQFYAHLRNRDYAALGAELAHMFDSDVTHGLCLGRHSCEQIRAQGPAYIAHMRTRLVALGQGLGIFSGTNTAEVAGELATPEGLTNGLSRIADVLGFDLASPQVGAYLGVRHDGKVIGLHQLLHLYSAHRLGTILGQPGGSCVEIGGGVGLMAYNAVRMGVAADYCIIDLPLVNLLQGYLLLRSDLADCVELYGEEPKPGNARRIRILPDFAIKDLADKSFDVVLNQDSLPEMGRETMESYLDTFPRLARKGFLSINQEARQETAGFVHGDVHSTCARDPRYQLVYRCPYWMRDGYVEEFYLCP